MSQDIDSYKNLGSTFSYKEKGYPIQNPVNQVYSYVTSLLDSHKDLIQVAQKKRSDIIKMNNQPRQAADLQLMQIKEEGMLSKKLRKRMSQKMQELEMINKSLMIKEKVERTSTCLYSSCESQHIGYQLRLIDQSDMILNDVKVPLEEDNLKWF